MPKSFSDIAREVAASAPSSQFQALADSFKAVNQAALMSTAQLVRAIEVFREDERREVAKLTENQRGAYSALKAHGVCVYDALALVRRWVPKELTH